MIKITADEVQDKLTIEVDGQSAEELWYALYEAAELVENKRNDGLRLKDYSKKVTKLRNKLDKALTKIDR